MSLGAFAAVGLAGCAGFSIVVALGAWLLAHRRRDGKSGRPQRVDPDREARDADRRNQQRLLAVLSRAVAPIPTPAGRWSPRDTNRVTGRAVLTFDAWRPLDADGARRSRRRGPEALLVGERWPFILAVDLAGLAPAEAATVAAEVLGHVRATPGTRARLLTGSEGALRDEVEAVVVAAGCAWAWSSGNRALDVSTEGTPI